MNETIVVRKTSSPLLQEAIQELKKQRKTPRLVREFKVEKAKAKGLQMVKRGGSMIAVGDPNGMMSYLMAHPEPAPEPEPKSKPAAAPKKRRKPTAKSQTV